MDPTQMPQMPMGGGMGQPMSPLPNLTAPMSTANSKSQGRLISSVNQSKGKKAIIKNRMKKFK
jgi:hypothetical protein